MKHVLLLQIVIMVIIAGCAEKKDNSNELSAKIDSLTKAVYALQQRQAAPAKDTIRIIQKDTIQTRPVQQPVKPPAITKPPTAPVVMAPSKPAEKVKNDTTRYYYTSPRRISVIITPWKEGKRTLLFFDPSGNNTYTITDTRSSYSDISEITGFHANGAVAALKRHLNPGASMYWYEDHISLNERNEPQWKTSIQFPERQLRTGDNKSYWDKKTGSWKQQTTVKEQPFPG
jgi:hypothetical protein